MNKTIFILGFFAAFVFTTLILNVYSQNITDAAHTETGNAYWQMSDGGFLFPSSGFCIVNNVDAEGKPINLDEFYDELVWCGVQQMEFLSKEEP